MGVLIRGLGWLVMGVGVASFKMSFGHGHGSEHWAGMALGVVLVGLGGILENRGKRMTQPTAEALTDADWRAPVLLLRAFSHDTTVTSMSAPITPIGISSVPNPSFEERLVKSLKHLGPVVAFGRPGETLPPLGAARTYQSSEQWQEKVLALAAEARLIVLLIGDTPSIQWEIEQMMSPALRPKLILLVTEGDAGGSLWQSLALNDDVVAVRFDDAGNPLPIRCEGDRIAALALSLRGDNPRPKNAEVVTHVTYRNANLPGFEVKAGARLPGSDFTAAVLPRARFYAADLRGSSFGSAVLDEANFEAAILNDCDFHDAKLRRCNLRSASLVKANLEGADLTETDLRTADLTDCRLTGTVLLGAWYDAGTRWPSAFDPRTHGAMTARHLDVHRSTLV